MSEKKDYLAILYTQMGSGSYARGSDRAKVLADLKRIFRTDWSSILGKAKKLPFEMQAVLWDVTGLDTVHWDSGNVFTIDEDGKKHYVDHDKAEIVPIIYERW